MCGQAGIILGKKRRTREERKALIKMFSQLLLLNQTRGKDATGVALVDSDGSYSLLKDATPAKNFISIGYLSDVVNLKSFTENTTLIAGHTRWATVGKPSNPRNNHPIVAGSVLGTHNGTIVNADQAANTLGVPRKATVDSEVIFRIATTLCLNAGRIDMDKLKSNLHILRGEMSSILVSRHDPETVIVLKGTKPLSLVYSKKARAVLYSSEDYHLNAVIHGSALGWRKIKVKKNRYLRFNHRSLNKYFIGEFEIQKPLPKYSGYKYSASQTRRSYQEAVLNSNQDWIDSNMYANFEDDDNLAVTYYPADRGTKEPTVIRKRKKKKKK